MHRKVSIIVMLLIFLSASYTQAKILPATQISVYDAARSQLLQNIRQNTTNSNFGNADLEALLALSIDFAGRRYSQFTGQYFNRNRYYQPKYGRFTSKDPIGFSGDSNLYRYTNSNPVLFTDPLGLWIIQSQGTKIYAVAEQNDEYFVDLGFGLDDALNQPEKSSGYMVDSCRVYKNDKFNITTYMPSHLSHYVGKRGIGNCFGVAMKFPYHTLTSSIAGQTDPTLAVPEYFALENQLFSLQLSQTPVVNSIAAWRQGEYILIPSLGFKVLPLMHLGRVIYVSKLSGIPSIFSKLGADDKGQFSIDTSSFLSSYGFLYGYYH